MKTALTFAASTLLILLAGCQGMSSSQNMTSAQQADAAMRDRLTQGGAENSSCNARVTSQFPEETEIVTSEIMPFQEAAANKMALMTNNKKPTKRQKDAFLKVIQARQQCRTAYIDSRRGSPFYSALAEYSSKLDILYAKFLNDQMTIGQLNEQRTLMYSEYRTRSEQDLQQYQRDMAMRHNQEISQRQQAAAIMLPYLQQQQQIQQQNYYNQQMLQRQQLQPNIYQAPVLQAPTLQPPIRTNCTTWGNITDCTTQ